MTFAATLLLLLATPAAEAPSGPVLLDFTASWCGPCKQMRPNIQALEAKGYPIKVVDGDANPELVQRYNVDAYPTFVLIDGKGREIDRTKGYQSAVQLAKFYNDARASYDGRQEAEDVEDVRQIGRRQKAPADDDEQLAESEADAPAFKNPKPWETVVRIKIHVSSREVGFGSGTIISSTPEESIILTCAHIFKIPGNKQLHPSQFNRKIEIHLFDGVLSRDKTPSLHYKETVEGEAIDYDFANDVGLIRIRPGKKLLASRVVPVDWKPRKGEPMITVGCSHGNDATAWDTKITNPRITLENQEIGKRFSVIECLTAPKQGRSGGGLYNRDGYVAGVCDFADPQSDRGLYAEPASIYRLLDRNKMAMLYKSDPNGRMLASNTPKPKAPARDPNRTITRAQSPEPDADVLVPSPESLGIPSPRVAASASKTGRDTSGWQPGRADLARTASAERPASRTRADNPPEIDQPTGPVPAEHTGAADADDRAFSSGKPRFNRANPEDIDGPSTPSQRSTTRGNFRPVRVE